MSWKVREILSPGKSWNLVFASPGKILKKSILMFVRTLGMENFYFIHVRVEFCWWLSVVDVVVAGVQHGGAVRWDGKPGRTDERPKCNYTTTAGIWLLTVLRLFSSCWTVATVSSILSAVLRTFYPRGFFHVCRELGRIVRCSSSSRNLYESLDQAFCQNGCNSWLPRHWCVIEEFADVHFVSVDTTFDVDA